MKRIALVLTVLVVAFGSFAAGQATKPVLKFPWAGEALNKDCGKTELEWKLAANRIEQLPAPIKLTKEFNLVHLVGTPTAEGLNVKANVVVREGMKPLPFGNQGYHAQMEMATRMAMWQVQERFGNGRQAAGVFEDCKNLAIELYVDGVLLATRTVVESKEVKPK